MTLSMLSVLHLQEQLPVLGAQLYPTSTPWCSLCSLPSTGLQLRGTVRALL